ncbi:MAG: hypothetical protein KDJ47_10165 [Hyphomicrobiaceae bacterium]|nr:hypothetical protein [Hyphomicrobiaceae bacterium]
MAESSKGTAPSHLTSAEIATLWHVERRTMRIYVLAVTVLAAAFGLASLGGYWVEVRYALILTSLALMLWALFIQFSIRCPRCHSRLATQSALLLPDKCKHCGVSITRPPSLDSELDV